MPNLKIHFVSLEITDLHFLDIFFIYKIMCLLQFEAKIIILKGKKKEIKIQCQILKF